MEPDRDKFFDLMSISDQARNQIDQEINRTLMVRMLNLGNILELVITITHHQMQFETETPACRAFPTGSSAFENLVLLNTPIIADRHKCRIYKANPAARSKRLNRYKHSQPSNRGIRCTKRA